ncbi:MAG: flagellar hook protein FlgE [Porticoccaceae bacterium]|jgi:flagellar hook protein FlgE
MGFSQALSGLNAAATNLDVIGNNIANSQTVGFKGSRTQFADIYASAQAGVTQAGLGTQVAGILQNFGTGTLENTGRPLDLAISGSGFFRFVQNDQIVYSRNGQLTLSGDGYLTNAQGARLTGYPAGVSNGGEPVTLQIPADTMQPRATSQIDVTLNLDAREPSYTNSATVYDSQGNAHDLTMVFTKDDTVDNTWEVELFVDGATAGTSPLEFDTNGLPVSGMSTLAASVTVGTNVEPLTFDFNINSTQFGSNSQLGALNQNGYAAGDLLGIYIDDKGNITGNYSNLKSQVLGTIALTNFTNPEGLQPIGDNAWVVTGNSGEPLTGLPGTGQLGSIEGGALEGSNVDLTRELVNLIIAQRFYQSNAQTVKVQDEVMQTTINMR